MFRPNKNFGEFLARECGYTERRIQQIKSYIRVQKALPERTIVRHESHARELVKVPEDKRVEVLEEAAHLAGGTGKVTAKVIKQAHEKVAGVIFDEMGFAIPEGDASYYWLQRSEPLELLSKVQVLHDQIEKISKVKNPLWTEIHPPGVLAGIGDALGRLKMGMPAIVCPKCDGIRPPKCDACHQTGLVSAFRYRQMLPELKTKREALLQAYRTKAAKA